MKIVSVTPVSDDFVAIEVAVDPEEEEERDWDQSTVDRLVEEGNLWNRPFVADDGAVAVKLVECQKLGLSFSVKLVENRPDTRAESDSQYFDSYNSIVPHRVMLQDVPRTSVYKAAIEKVASGKSVLDVGCGTGILSIFAAKGGARAVTGVEPSGMAEVAREIVADNQVASIVSVRNMAVEEMSGEEKFDVIVSEWMGFYLLHESMLESVLWARDNLLRPGGLLLPNRATLLACPVTLDAMVDEEVNFFRETQYGLDLGRLSVLARRSMSASSPHICQVPASELAGTPAAVAELDLNTVGAEELRHIAKRLTFPDVPAGRVVRGVALWFDSEFSAGHGGNPLTLNTGPCAAPTHWKQSVVVLPEDVAIPRGDQAELRAEVILSQDVEGNRRQYTVAVNVEIP